MTTWLITVVDAVLEEEDSGWMTENEPAESGLNVEEGEPAEVDQLVEVDQPVEASINR